MLAGFQSEFSVERRDRLTREGRIMKQLTDHAQDMTEKWQEESSERKRDADEIKSRLEHHENSRTMADNDYDSLISSELKSLKDELQQETVERKVEDDEIVEALNRYTDNLQKSLSMLD
jgi:transposase